MDAVNVTYLLEIAAYDADIEAINAEAFGPGRFARAAYRIREGGPHERQLSFVAVYAATVVASVRLTRAAAGAGRALLLGPLAVRPAYKNIGIGRQLVTIALEAAEKAGAPAVILVGDEPVSALDRAQGAAVLARLCERHETAVFALHDIPLALSRMDRVIVLDEGRIVLDAPARDLHPADLVPWYGG